MADDNITQYHRSILIAITNQHQMDTVLLTYNKLSTEDAQVAVGMSHAGGISLFVGTTRDNFDGRRVTWLEYEAYEEMAVKQMKRLCDHARDKWHLLVKLCVMHRLGRVPVGEASVIIAVSSAHRREAIGAYKTLLRLTLNDFFYFYSVHYGQLFVDETNYLSIYFYGYASFVLHFFY